MTDELRALLESSKRSEEYLRRINQKFAFLFWGPMILAVVFYGLVFLVALGG